MITHHPNLSIQKALQLVGLTTEKLLPMALWDTLRFCHNHHILRTCMKHHMNIRVRLSLINVNTVEKYKAYFQKTLTFMSWIPIMFMALVTVIANSMDTIRIHNCKNHDILMDGHCR